MSDKDEIIDLGEAVIAIIQSPPGTWLDGEGLMWRWNGMVLQQDRLGGVWADRETYELAGYLPITRVRYWSETKHELFFPEGLAAGEAECSGLRIPNDDTRFRGRRVVISHEQEAKE